MRAMQQRMPATAAAHTRAANCVECERVKEEETPREGCLLTVSRHPICAASNARCTRDATVCTDEPAKIAHALRALRMLKARER